MRTRGAGYSAVNTQAMSLWRFVTCRGKPFELLLDHYTNFKGEVGNCIKHSRPWSLPSEAAEQIRFLFNPFNAPDFGGSWEREVRSVKTALRTTLGAQTVSEEVLRTMLIEVESILNSRPLGCVSTDIADPGSCHTQLFVDGAKGGDSPCWLFLEALHTALPAHLWSTAEMEYGERRHHCRHCSSYRWSAGLKSSLASGNREDRHTWNQDRGRPSEDPDQHSPSSSAHQNARFTPWYYQDVVEVSLLANLHTKFGGGCKKGHSPASFSPAPDRGLYMT